MSYLKVAIMEGKEGLIILPSLNDAGGNLSKQWFVYFSVKNPLTEKFKRFKIYKGLLKETAVDRHKAAALIITTLTEKLKNGWTPYDDADKMVYSDSLVYHHMAKNYGRIKKTNRTMNFAASEFIEFKTSKLAAKSMSSYNSKLRALVAWCNNNGLTDTDISAFTNAHIKAFFEFLIITRNLDKVTVKKYRQTFHSFFNWVEQKYGLKNPVYDIELPIKKIDNAARPIIQVDLIRLLDAVEFDDPQLYLAMLVQYYSAVRPGNELLNLRIKDIDLYNNQAVISAVTAKRERRVVTLPKPLVKIMTERYLLQTFNPEFFVFGRYRVPGPERMGQNTLRQRFNQYRTRLNLPEHYKYYSMKHTGAGKLLESGRTIVEVSNWCGHTSIEHTEHYVRRHFGIKNTNVINEFPDPRS